LTRPLVAGFEVSTEDELAWDHHTGARARHERQTGFASPERLGFADCEPSQLVPELVIGHISFPGAAVL